MGAALFVLFNHMVGGWGRKISGVGTQNDRYTYHMKRQKYQSTVAGQSFFKGPCYE